MSGDSSYFKSLDDLDIMTNFNLNIIKLVFNLNNSKGVLGWLGVVGVVGVDGVDWVVGVVGVVSMKS